MELYNTLEKIDAHMHYNAPRPALLEAARAEGFRFLSINTEVPFFPSLQRQEQIVRELPKQDRQRVDRVTSFSTREWGTPGWQDQALEQIKSGLDSGAVGVKVWKNIGMTLRDSDGNFVMIDDPSFDPLFDFCEREGIPVLGHLGEPKNCWLPVEEMTVNGDRAYFSEHPEYHMYLHPEYPSYEEQLEARDQRLERNPELRFVGAHLASLEWSVDRLAGWLDRFPNTAVDLAERICHLQYQAVRQWEKVRDFVRTYQDRIIYGTDLIDDGSLSAEEIQDRISGKWRMHWNFFCGAGEMTVPKVEGGFQALNLGDRVLKKLFRENALRWYPGLDR